MNDRDLQLASINAAYSSFESSGDLHELARAVGTILGRREED